MKDETSVECYRAWAARRAERFGLALNFWLHLFEEKRWKTNTERLIASVKKLQIDAGSSPA